MQLVVVLVSLNSIYAVVSYTFPEEFERCHLSDSNLDDCLKLTIENSFHLLGSAGIPSLNLPSIDPLEITRVEIGAGTSAVHLVQTYSDIKLFGISKCTVTNAQ